MTWVHGTLLLEEPLTEEVGLERSSIGEGLLCVSGMGLGTPSGVPAWDSVGVFVCAHNIIQDIVYKQ